MHTIVIATCNVISRIRCELQDANLILVKTVNQDKVFINNFSVNITDENSSQTKKPQTDKELPPDSLPLTSVKFVGISLGVALVCGVSFHLLWNRRSGEELKQGDHKSGKQFLC